jgi:hypothetical protein
LQKYESFAVEVMAHLFEIERTKGTKREPVLLDLLTRSAKDFREGLNAHLESRLIDQISKIRTRLDKNPELREEEAA